MARFAFHPLLAGVSGASLVALAAACSGAGDSGSGFAAQTAGGASSGGASAGGSSSGGTLSAGGSSSGGTLSAGGSSSGGTLSAGGSSAGGAGGAQQCAGVSQEANNAQLPADVVWALDTSCSMAEETKAVRDNMNLFSNGIVSAGVDIKNILIAEQWQKSPFPNLIPDEGICIGAPLGSGQCPGDTNPAQGYFHIYQTVASTDALQLFISTFPTWRSLLRPNSAKILVVVTDDDSALDAAGFTQQFNALEPALIVPNSWKMYGIYCFTNCPSAANQGTVYETLRQQTGGVGGDLCLQNFQPVFNQLAAGIVGSSKLACGWAIPPPPAGESFNRNLVNVEFTPSGGAPQTIGHVNTQADCGPNGGWYYDNDANPQNVLVCPQTCTVIQSDSSAKIDVRFGCETVEQPPA